MASGNKVVIIGAGAVGKSFGYLLSENGYEILGFLSNSLESAQEGVDLIGVGIATTDYDNFIKEADLILITTPDQAINIVAEKLFNLDLLKNKATLVHLSGALTSDILTADSDRTYGRLSLHPLQAIANVEQGINKLPNSFFTIEGNNLGIKKGKKILNLLNVDYKIITKAAKPLYHAAACVASNYLVAIVDLAIKMMQEVGISEDDALSALMPLIKGSVANIAQSNPAQALTGPLARGDRETIKEHLISLDTFLPEKIKLYSQLAEQTIELAKEKGSISEFEVKRLCQIIQEGVNNEE